MNGVETQELGQSEEATVAEAVGRGLRALDCGCGSGRVVRALVARGCQVDGIELSERSLRVARESCVRAVQGSVTEPATWEQLGDQKYDAIVYCHVLEHIMDPFVALELARPRLAPSGTFVIALPNVATWRMRMHLLRGRWDYADEGILDRTHVKFYTQKTARELLASANLDIVSERLITLPPGGGALRRQVVRAVRKLSPLASTHAFLFVARPRSAS